MKLCKRQMIRMSAELGRFFIIIFLFYFNVVVRTSEHLLTTACSDTPTSRDVHVSLIHSLEFKTTYSLRCTRGSTRSHIGGERRL